MSEKQNNLSYHSEVNPISNPNYDKIWKSINIGDEVEGKFEGTFYKGKVTHAEDIRKPRGAGVAGYIWVIKLNSSIVVFGVERTTIRLKLINNEYNDNTIHLSNPSVRKRMRKIKQPRKGRESTRSNYRAKNPSEAMQEAMELNERFHGRDTREIINLIDKYKYVSDGAVLGELIELTLVVGKGKGIPIHFGSNKDENKSDSSRPLVIANSGATQLYIMDGDQSLPLEDLGLNEDDSKKQYVYLGECFSITYFTDKHHLEGPKYQANGTSYEHEFGEEGGELPMIVYDTLNEKIMLVGGTYKIESEGIRN